MLNRLLGADYGRFLAVSGRRVAFTMKRAKMGCLVSPRGTKNVSQVGGLLRQTVLVPLARSVVSCSRLAVTFIYDRAAGAGLFGRKGGSP
jgi:hypothetical protein